MKFTRMPLSSPFNSPETRLSLRSGSQSLNAIAAGGVENLSQKHKAMAPASSKKLAGDAVPAQGGDLPAESQPLKVPRTENSGTHPNKEVSKDAGALLSEAEAGGEVQSSKGIGRNQAHSARPAALRKPLLAPMAARFKEPQQCRACELQIDPCHIFRLPANFQQLC